MIINVNHRDALLGVARKLQDEHLTAGFRLDRARRAFEDAPNPASRKAELGAKREIDEVVQRITANLEEIRRLDEAEASS